MTKIEMNKVLFAAGKALPNGWKVGNYGARGIVSNYHNTPSKKAQLSMVAIILSLIEKKELHVASIDGQNAVYVEVKNSRDEWIPAIASVEGKDFTVTIQNPPPGDANAVLTGVNAAVVAAFLYGSGELIRTLQKTYGLQVEIEQFRAICKNVAKEVPESLDINSILIACDLFQYGIAKNGLEEISVQREGDMTPMLEQLSRSGVLDVVSESRKPVLIKAEEKKASGSEAMKFMDEPLAVFYERCRGGFFVIQYPWDESVKENIVPLSYLDGYFPTESFRTLLLSIWYQLQDILNQMREGKTADEILGKNPLNIKVMGKPGTGKTATIEAVLATLGYPKGLINCKERMEEDEIEGLNKFIEGQVRSIATKAVELHSVGGAVCLEEANLPDSGILQGALGQALAYPFVLKRDGYVEMKRHPLTIYFATMNIGTSGTKPMNEAFSSRFPEGHILEDVSEKEFVGILQHAGYQKNACQKVYRTYKKILKYLSEFQEELVLTVTLRHCLNALDKMKIGFTEQKAYELTFISQLYSVDPLVAEEVKEILDLK